MEQHQRCDCNQDTQHRHHRRIDICKCIPENILFGIQVLELGLVLPTQLFWVGFGLGQDRVGSDRKLLTYLHFVFVESV